MFRIGAWLMLGPPSPQWRPVRRELQRHEIVRGLWARLLDCSRAWLRIHDLLGDSEQLPEGDVHQQCSLWEQVVQFLPFTEVSQRACHRRPHINVGELWAALGSEASDGHLATGSRKMIGTDSQVAPGALSKGRSSSRPS